MMTFGYLFDLQGDALAGGITARTSPSGTSHGSHRRARAGYKYWLPWWDAQCLVRQWIHILRQLEDGFVDEFPIIST